MTITEAGRAGARLGQAVAAASRTATTQEKILTLLRARPLGGAQAAWIAAVAEISRSSANRNLRKLITDGLVTRFVDPHDGRARRYRVTEQGRNPQ